MTTQSKQEDLRRMMTYQLYDSSVVDYRMAAIIDKATDFINSEVLAVLEELEKAVRSPISLIGSEKFKGGVVPLSAIQTIKEKYL